MRELLERMELPKKVAAWLDKKADRNARVWDQEPLALMQLLVLNDVIKDGGTVWLS